MGSILSRNEPSDKPGTLHDNPSQVASVTWDFYGDGTVVTTTPTTSTAFTYTRAGTFHPTVTVLLSDGSRASRTITLRVQSPTEAMATTVTLVDWLDLSPGLTISLVSKLTAASDATTEGNGQAACGEMQAFENELHALVRSGQLDEADAAPRLDEAAAIGSRSSALPRRSPRDLSLAIIASEQRIVDVGAAAGHAADDAIRAADGCGASVRPVSRVETYSSRPSRFATSWAFSLVPIDASAPLTACSGWFCAGCGPGGGKRWCWSSQPLSIGGIAKDSVDGGAVPRGVLEDHVTIHHVEI
jgi:hypothetical protein